MGNCLGRSADSNNANERVSEAPSRNKALSKGRTLKRDKSKWRCDVPLSAAHIVHKREEFWDTAPAFEGRREIWDALKAAVEALEKDDYELSQAIIDGANIILPSGSLRDCYDELGNRYQLPLYVLSYPSNIASTSPTEKCTIFSQKRFRCKNKSYADICAANSEKDCQSLRSRNKSGESHSKVTLNLRLSTGKDFKIVAYTDQTIENIKEQFATTCGFPKFRQRWYCYGKLIENSSLLSQCTIPEHFIVQVIVHNPGEDNSDIMEG